MIRISKNERAYLIKNGVNVGSDGIISNKSHHRSTWYLTESKENMRILNKFRNGDSK